MLDAMFEMPSMKSKEFRITVEYASSRLDKIDMKVLRAS
jgi:hypothetical protein